MSRQNIKSTSYQSIIQDNNSNSSLGRNNTSLHNSNEGFSFTPSIGQRSPQLNNNNRQFSPKQNEQQQNEGPRLLSHKIYFCFNNPTVSEQELSSIFSNYGEISTIKLLKDPKDPKFRYGFLTFTSLQSSVALLARKKVKIGQTSIRVRLVKERNAKKAKIIQTMANAFLQQQSRDSQKFEKKKIESQEKLASNSPIRQIKEQAQVNAPTKSIVSKICKKSIRLELEKRHREEMDLLVLRKHAPKLQYQKHPRFSPMVPKFQGYPYVVWKPRYITRRIQYDQYGFIILV